MNRKVISAVSLSALLFTVSCGAFKPDHPQIYKSFKDRRSPKENAMAASGNYDNNLMIAKNENTFIPYSGRSSNANNTNTAAVNSNSNSNSNANNTFSPNSSLSSRSSAIAEKATASTSSAGESLLEKILRALNLGSSNTNVSSIRRVAANTEEVAALEHNAHLGQGSANTYSHYDTAEEIPQGFAQVTTNAPTLATPPAPPTPPAPVPQVMAPVPTTTPDAPTTGPAESPSKHAAQPSEQPPTVTLPSEPTLDEMKNKAVNQPIPELKDVPKAPEEFKDKNVNPIQDDNPTPKATTQRTKGAKEQKGAKKKGAAKHKKSLAKHKGLPEEQYRKPNENYEMGIVGENAIRDRSSRLEYINGKPVVTGYLDEECTSR